MRIALLALASALNAGTAAAQSARVDTATTLTVREQANAEAVARLLGVVRFFHPSDAAAAADWDSITVATMRSAIGAADDADLARRLERALAPVAPSVTFRVGIDTARSAAMPDRPAAATAVVRWVHDGVLLTPGQGPYRVRRARWAWTGAELPDSVPDPRRPVRVAIGRGVVAWVPVALWADAAGTLPRTPVAAMPPWADTSRVAKARDSVRYTTRDRVVRLAGVALAWSVLDHFYPYFDVVRVDWDVELRRALRDAAAAGDACALRTTLARMVAALRDGHGSVRHRCQPMAALPFLLAHVEGRPIVIAAHEEARGVRVGDEIVSIDGEPIARRLARLRQEIGATTARYAHSVETGAVLMGPAGVDVRVGLVHADGRRDAVVLRRSRAAWTLSEPRPPAMHEVRPGIWYVDLERITTKQWLDSLPVLEKASGLVFDMRGYPYELDSREFFPHLSLASLSGPRLSVARTSRPRSGPRHAPLPFAPIASWSIARRAPYLAAPKAFIADGRAISYAETIMGIVEHHRLGAIVGEATAGTNGNANQFTVPGGYTLRWTGMRVLKHDGTRHHGVGIRPTVPVARTRAGIVAGRDEQLERAIAIVSTQSALRR